MKKKALLMLKPKDSQKKLKGLEGKTIEAEINTDFEGGATFFFEDGENVIVNSKGEYAIRRGRKHIFNLSKYLEGAISGYYSIRIYNIS